MAHITPDSANPQGKIDIEAFKSPSEVTKEGALQLTVQDAQSAEAFLTTNYWSLRWREADALYQSPPSILMWDGTVTPRANVNRFVVAETVNAIHPQIMNGLFYEKPAFKLRPRPNQTENTSRAISALLEIELDQMDIRQEIDWLSHSALLFGTGIGKWGFKSYTKKVPKYVAVGDNVTIPSSIKGEPATKVPTAAASTFAKVIEDEEVHVPTFENKDIRFVLVDPGLRVPDIRKAKFVIDRMYLTYKDLIKLKDEQYVETDENGKQTLKNRYDLPSEAEIKKWFQPPKEEPKHPGSDLTLPQGTAYMTHAEPVFKATTADPLDEPLEVLERWDNDKVITVINRVKVIRNEPNEFGVIPFLSVNWWNIPDAFWGLGLGRVIGAEQRVQQGLINACLDLASLIVNPMFIRARGANIQEQQIRQRVGGIIAVDVGGNSGLKAAGDAIKILEQPQIPNEIIQQISLSEGRVEKTSGANQQLTMGANPTSSKGQMGRSGTGAAGIIQATMNRIGGFAEMIVRQVYEPLLYQMHQLNKDKMPMAYVKKLLGEKLGKDFQFDPSDMLNAPAEFEVLAGSHLAAKAQMAQSLFMMIQIFDSPAMLDQLSVQGKKVNVEEMLHMLHDVSGYKNYYDIIQDMTPEDQARKQAQSQGGLMQQKLQGQMALNNQKAQQQSALEDQANEARAVRDVFRIIAEKSSEPQALLGAEAPTQGEGSIEVG